MAIEMMYTRYYKEKILKFKKTNGQETIAEWFLANHYRKRNIFQCGLVESARTWNRTGCEFESWQCRIHIPCSYSLRLSGSLQEKLHDLGSPWGEFWSSINHPAFNCSPVVHCSWCLEHGFSVRCWSIQQSVSSLMRVTGDPWNPWWYQQTLLE